MLCVTRANVCAPQKAKLRQEYLGFGGAESACGVCVAPPRLCSRRTVVFGTPADTAMPSNYFLNIVLGITALVLLCYFGGILPK